MAFDPDAYFAKREAAKGQANTSKAVNTPSNGEPVGPAAAHSLDAPLRFLRGGSRRVMETLGEAPLRGLADLGLPFAKKAVEGFEAHKKETPLGTAGDLGGAAADVGLLMAPTPFGKAGTVTKAASMAGQGVLQHQAQNYAREGAIRPGEAAAEMAISTAIPVAGQAVAKGAKWAAPKILENLTKRAMKGGDNPVDWTYALRNKLVPYFGGAKEISARTAPKVAARDNLRNELLDKSGSKVSITDAINRTLKNLRKNVGGEGSGRITAGQMSKAEPFADDVLLTAKAQTVTGKRAVNLRKIADDRAKAGFDDKASAELQAEGVFNREYRDQLEDGLLNSMRPKDAVAMSGEISRAAKRGGPAEIDLALAANEAQKGRFGRYAANKQTLSKLTPIDIAAQDMAKAPHKLGTMIDLGLGATALGAPFVGDNDATKAIPALTLLAAKRGATTPGGARMLYEIGRGAGNKTGRAMLNLGRTGAFSHSEDN